LKSIYYHRVSNTRNSADIFGVPRVPAFSRDSRRDPAREKPAPARESKKNLARLRAARARNEKIFGTM
jgi:hypothetical protein